MSIFICVILSSITAWFVFKPFIDDSKQNEQFIEKTDLMLLTDQKNRSVNMLRDLELDYSTGKLSKEEYEDIKLDLSQEMSEILTKIDQTK